MFPVTVSLPPVAQFFGFRPTKFCAVLDSLLFLARAALSFTGLTKIDGLNYRCFSC
jgi:hypothetical protein